MPAPLIEELPLNYAVAARPDICDVEALVDTTKARQTSHTALIQEVSREYVCTGTTKRKAR